MTLSNTMHDLTAPQSPRALERITGLGRDRMARILEGTPADTTGPHPRYTIKQVVKSLITDLTGAALTLDQQRILESAARTEESKVRKQRLDIQVGQLKEELVPAAEVKDFTMKILMILRSRLLALPTKIGPQVKGLDIPATVAAIKTEVYQYLTETADALQALAQEHNEKLIKEEIENED